VFRRHGREGKLWFFGIVDGQGCRSIGGAGLPMVWEAQRLPC
jgi:hypothetical protein